MNDRKIIVGMLEEIFEEQYEHRRLITAVHTADHLISHGVTVQKHGRWEEWWPGINLIMTGEEMLYRCSACDAKYAYIKGKNYCPNCGAKMEEGEA